MDQNARCPLVPNQQLCSPPSSEIGPMETPERPVVIRKILPVEGASPEFSDMEWLLSPNDSADRRKDQRFRKLTGIVTGVRRKLKITRKKHEAFWPGVKRSIDLFSLACRECPLSFDNPAHREAVAKVLQFNTKNYIGKENMKAKKHKSSAQDSLRSLESKKDHETNTMEEDHDIPPAHDACDADAQTEDLLPNPPQAVSNICLNNGDVVAVMNKRSVIAIGDVVEAIVQRPDGSYDHTKARLRILAMFAEIDSMERGSCAAVSLRHLALIPGGRLELYQELSRAKGRCQRGDNCKLSPDTMVLLDLDYEFLGFWPLVAKVKSVKAKDDKKSAEISIIWYEAIPDTEADGHLVDAKYVVWKIEKKIQEGLYRANCHYYCGFELTDTSRLPNLAKLAAKEHVENCTRFE